LALPALYGAADETSLGGQQSLRRGTAAGLVLGVLAAVAGATDTRWAAVFGAIFFLVALLVGIYVFLDRPEKAWYDGRAAAESVKSLAWQYAVGGGLFPLDEGEDPDQLLLERLSEILSKLEGFALVGNIDHGEQVTETMRTMRRAPLSERKTSYEAGRVEDQRAWYAAKAKWNGRRMRFWRIGGLVLQGLGGMGAILRAADIIDFDVLGVFAAAAVAAAAWLQAKDHANLAEAYGVTAQELGLVKERVREPRDELTWAQAVEDAESAISREHTLWLARRGATSLRR
jgi:SMODS and SLOG-associating 2TM effector domain 3/SMODS and SLOG-associating 2TM effector domain 1